MDNNIFPLPFNIHLAFTCIAFIIFIFQYSRKKRTYQILMAIAFPLTFLLYINTSNLWHYCVGALELIIIISAIISSIMDRKKLKAAEQQENTETNEETKEV